MRRDPLLPFGAVVGDGADQEHDVADQGRPGGHVEQFGEAASVLVAAVALGHADPGVPDRGGHRPGAQAVVLDHDELPPPTRAAVRTEAFVSFVVPETRIAKQAREFGGGLDGRTASCTPWPTRSPPCCAAAWA